MICKRPNGICQCNFIFSGEGINGAHTDRNDGSDYGVHLLPPPKAVHGSLVGRSYIM